MPSVRTVPTSSQGMALARWIRKARAQPARSATSTRRSEFELLGAPTTSRQSMPGAIAFTAACRFVVA